jgi:hypothetical protein
MNATTTLIYATARSYVVTTCEPLRRAVCSHRGSTEVSGAYRCSRAQMAAMLLYVTDVCAEVGRGFETCPHRCPEPVPLSKYVPHVGGRYIPGELLSLYTMASAGFTANGA